MKTFIHSSTLICALLFASTVILFAQGALTPSGPPAPTMKSLDQIASTGIAINATNTSGTSANLYIISQPGSYYLTGNITGVSGKHGISIQANNVTVDLNGFAVTSPSATTFNGIDVPSSFLNVTIRNGTLTGWHIGVNAANVTNGLFEQLRLYVNGTGLSAGTNGLVKDCVSYNNTADGIDTMVSCTVTNCLASGNNGRGISAGGGSTVSNCSALLNGGNGISTGGSSAVSNCTASNNSVTGISAGTTGTGNGDCAVNNCSANFNGVAGIFTGGGSTVSNGSANFNTNGISISDGSTVTNCSATNNTDGIKFGANCLVTGNNSNGNSGDGIHATAGGNRIESNSVWNNSNAGIEPAAINQKNVIIKNSAGNNNSGGNNYALASGNNDYGPFSSNPSTATNPLTNFQ